MTCSGIVIKIQQLQSARQAQECDLFGPRSEAESFCAHRLGDNLPDDRCLCTRPERSGLKSLEVQERL